MAEERQDKINHENKLLYKKMTAILKNGGGNSCSPVRSAPGKNAASFRNTMGLSVGVGNLRQDTESLLMHHGRSVTARPSH